MVVTEFNIWLTITIKYNVHPNVSIIWARGADLWVHIKCLFPLSKESKSFLRQSGPKMALKFWFATTQNSWGKEGTRYASLIYYPSCESALFLHSNYHNPFYMMKQFVNKVEKCISYVHNTHIIIIPLFAASNFTNNIFFKK